MALNANEIDNMVDDFLNDFETPLNGVKSPSVAKQRARESLGSIDELVGGGSGATSGASRIREPHQSFVETELSKRRQEREQREAALTRRESELLAAVADEEKQVRF
jgi:hypothetical protein